MFENTENRGEKQELKEEIDDERKTKRKKSDLFLYDDFVAAALRMHK